MARTIDELPWPPGLPLLGNAHQLARASRLHTVCERWADRYGPILRADIGRRRIVGISDADAVNMILRERPEGFRRWSVQQVVFDEMGLSGVFTAEGEQWKRQRRLLRYPNLGDGFDPGRLLRSDESSAPKVLTFGAGPRFCPGRNLAFLEAKSALAMIARNFHVELDSTAGPVSEYYNFVTIPKGLRVRLTQRSRQTVGAVTATGA
jgi:cytochrome P450